MVDRRATFLSKRRLEQKETPSFVGAGEPTARLALLLDPATIPTPTSLDHPDQALARWATRSA
jgi:hypothetical protein